MPSLFKHEERATPQTSPRSMSLILSVVLGLALGLGPLGFGLKMGSYAVHKMSEPARPKYDDLVSVTAKGKAAHMITCSDVRDCWSGIGVVCPGGYTGWDGANPSVQHGPLQEYGNDVWLISVQCR